MPEVRDFLEQFADVPIQCARAADRGLVEDLAEHQRRAGLLREPDPGRLAAVVLVEAIANDTGRFDASDLMPAGLVPGSFWTGMVKYMQEGPDSLEDSPRRDRGELARANRSTPGEG